MDTPDAAGTSTWRANVALAVSAVALVVSILAYSPTIFAFFGQPTPAHQLKRHENARQFMEAMADPGWGKLYDATHMLEKGSPAESYVEAVYWLRNAHETRTGETARPGTVAQEGDLWKVCHDEALTDCTSFDHFEFNEADQIKQARRNNALLLSPAVEPGSEVTEDGVIVAPLGGRILENGEYALRLRNTTEDTVTVVGCQAMEHQRRSAPSSE